MRVAPLLESSKRLGPLNKVGTIRANLKNGTSGRGEGCGLNRPSRCGHEFLAGVSGSWSRQVLVERQGSPLRPFSERLFTPTAIPSCRLPSAQAARMRLAPYASKLSSISSSSRTIRPASSLRFKKA